MAKRLKSQPEWFRLSALLTSEPPATPKAPPGALGLSLFIMLYFHAPATNRTYITLNNNVEVIQSVYNEN